VRALEVFAVEAAVLVHADATTRAGSAVAVRQIVRVAGLVVRLLATFALCLPVRRGLRRSAVLRGGVVGLLLRLACLRRSRLLALRRPSGVDRRRRRHSTGGKDRKSTRNEQNSKRSRSDHGRASTLPRAHCDSRASAATPRSLGNQGLVSSRPRPFWCEA